MIIYIKWYVSKCAFEKEEGQFLRSVFLTLEAILRMMQSIRQKFMMCFLFFIIEYLFLLPTNLKS